MSLVQKQDQLPPDRIRHAEHSVHHFKFISKTDSLPQWVISSGSVLCRDVHQHPDIQSLMSVFIHVYSYILLLTLGQPHIVCLEAGLSCSCLCFQTKLTISISKYLNTDGKFVDTNP